MNQSEQGHVIEKTTRSDLGDWVRVYGIEVRSWKRGGGLDVMGGDHVTCVVQSEVRIWVECMGSRSGHGSEAEDRKGRHGWRSRDGLSTNQEAGFTGSGKRVADG